MSKKNKKESFVSVNDTDNDSSVMDNEIAGSRFHSHSERDETATSEEAGGESGHEAQDNNRNFTESENGSHDAVQEVQEAVLNEKAKIAALESEISELKDLYLRKQADFENFRKRMLREKEESIKYANSSLLIDVVAIIDDFERAIKSGEESRDFDSFHSGIALIEKQFINLLERKWGLKRLESIGKEFDPEKHEAIGMEPSDEHEIQTVVEDYQRGYMLHDRVLRHAKVKVAMPVPKEDDSEKTE